MDQHYQIVRTHSERFRVYALALVAIVGVFISPAVQAQTQERQYGRLHINVERGVRIGVGNRTTGRITIKGWDRDVIEAHALSIRGDEVVIVNRSEESNGKRYFLKADFADLNNPLTPNSRVDSPPEVDGESIKVHLELKVPRYTEIESIEVWNSDVEVSDVDTPIAVSGRRSRIILKRVGAAEVHTRSGSVEIDGVNGLAAVVTTSGAIRVNNSRSLIRAVSITGPIEVQCSVGRVDVSNTEAPIELLNVDGDVDAIATNSSVKFTGAVREGGRYYLKSMSGRVEMVIPAGTRGFEAILTSYRGTIETDFKLTTKQPVADFTQNRRLVGRFGNGKAHVLLDSFEGLVRLTKFNGASVPVCK